MVKMKEEHEAVEVDVFEINMGDVEDTSELIFSRDRIPTLYLAMDKSS